MLSIWSLFLYTDICICYPKKTIEPKLPGGTKNMTVRQSVLIVCDGLRKDMVTPEYAPSIIEFSKSSCRYLNYKSVFPSTTRVVSASMATGCMPYRHGLAGNTVVLKEANGLSVFSAGTPEFRDRLRKATGRTLKKPTVAEQVAPHGGSIVFSNVSPGGAYFQDPDGYGSVYHRAGSYGPGCRPVAKSDELAITIGHEGDRVMTERFCEEVMLKRRPAHAVLWLSEPDHTSHHFPLGSSEYRAAIRHADECVSRVLETIESMSHENILVMICSDHGHETIDAIVDIGDLLVKERLKSSLNSNDVLVAPNGGGALIYLSPEASSRETEIFEYLETQAWTHQVYRDDELESIGQCRSDGLFIAVDLKHSEKPNDFGIPGVCVAASDPTGKQFIGCGAHGGLGQYVQAPFLMVRGAEFNGGIEMLKPVSPMDIAPTVLQHLGISWKGMDGTPLSLIS